MTAVFVGYARCSTDKQDLHAIRQILLHMRTREGMAIARAKVKRKGRAPKLSTARQAHLLKLHAAGEHTVVELAELFEVSRPTVYRVLEGAHAHNATAVS